MPTIQGVSLTSDANANNVLAGSTYEILPGPALVEFFVVGDAAGLARATIQAGPEVLLEDNPISRAARSPIVPDDLTTRDTALANDRLRLAIRSTGAAVSVQWRVQITPLA